jgi:multicomponent Na+:H+ antiporter subunit F
VLLANTLLALAWAALQGEFSLGTLLAGYVLGYLVLAALARGGVLRESRYVGRVHRVIGLAAYFLWELVLVSNGVSSACWADGDDSMPTLPSLLALTMLAVAAGLTFIRLAKGPMLPDRVIAIDLIGVLMVCLLVVMAGATRELAFLDVAMVIALISFVGTVAYARYIEREGS